ncbi:MAG TPA: hypothetical protein VN622_02725 [Clostridia bacterium]|nr:hypothetical protein [Clostridia bacterium]
MLRATPTMLLPQTISRWTVFGLVLAGVTGGTAAAISGDTQKPPATATRSTRVFFDGKVVWFTPAMMSHSAYVVLGPWQLAATRAKPRDGRPNLYIVSPGTQFQGDGAYDHNLVISHLDSPGEIEFDVYYALVLDPLFKADIRDERDLIVAAQQTFTPGDLFEFGDIPSAALLRDQRFENISDLDGFRRADGSLPKLIVLPARATVRGTVDEQGEQLSHFGRTCATPGG